MNKEFLVAIMFRTSQILEDFAKGGSPDTIYDYKEVITFMKDCINEIENHYKSTYPQSKIEEMLSDSMSGSNK